MFKIFARLFKGRQCAGCTQDRLSRAVNEFARTVFCDYPSNHMTCFEADSLAKILVLAGHNEKAEALLLAHAASDTDEDDSHNIDELSWEEAQEAMRDHVRFLTYA